MRITGRANEHVKRMRALNQLKARRETGLHIIEGEKLLDEALQSGMEIVDVFVRDGEAIARPFDACVHQVTDSVMDAISTMPTPQGVAAAVRTPNTDSPAAYPTGLIVALERVQDPGNVGAIIRSADAMGAAGVLISPDSADPYSPKTLRAAMGSNYHLPIWVSELPSALDTLSREGAVLIAGHLEGKEAFPKIGGRCVLVIGNEGSGVSEAVAARCEKVRLPMKGRAESLNASVAAGIFLYELAKMIP